MNSFTKTCSLGNNKQLIVKGLVVDFTLFFNSTISNLLLPMTQNVKLKDTFPKETYIRFSLTQ